MKCKSFGNLRLVVGHGRKMNAEVTNLEESPKSASSFSATRLRFGKASLVYESVKLSL